LSQLAFPTVLKLEPFKSIVAIEKTGANESPWLRRRHLVLRVKLRRKLAQY
jgi:hypothetical protein